MFSWPLLGVWSHCGVNTAIGLTLPDTPTILAILMLGLLIASLWMRWLLKSRSRELKEANRQLELILKHANDGIYVIELSLHSSWRRFTMFNDRYVELSGFSREELMARSKFSELAEHIAPDMDDLEIRRRLYAGETVVGMSSWLRPDGKENYIEWRSRRIPMSGATRPDSFFIVGIDRDVTGRETAGRKFARKLEIEQAISAISSRFVAPGDLDVSVHETLSQIGRMTGAGRSYVFLINEDGRTISNTHEWCDEGVRRDQEKFQRIPIESHGWLAQRLREDRIVHFGDLGEMPEEAAELRHILLEQDVKAVLMLPLAVQGREFGFIGFDNMKESRCWVDEDIYLLRVTAEIVSTALESRRINLTLQRSEQQMRLILKYSSDSINICLADFETGSRQLVLCNEKYIEMSGRSREELMVCENLNDWVVHHRTKEEEKHIRGTLMSGQPTRGEASWIRPDGQENYYEWTGAPFFIDGKLHVIGIDRDVTARRGAEQALRDSENLLSSIIEQSPVATWIADREGTNIRQNGACRELFGISSDEQTVGKYNLFRDNLLRSMGHMDDLKKVFSEGRTFTGELDYDLSKVEGMEVPGAVRRILRCTIFPIRDGKGDVVNAVVQNEDITARRQAEEALRKSEQWLRLILEHANDGINICEIDVKAVRRWLVTCNDKFVEMTGRTREELLSAPHVDVFLKHKAPIPDAWIPLAAGRGDQGTCSWDRPDGKENIVEWRAAPFWMDDRLFVVGIDRDITERKASEAALKAERDFAAQLIENAEAIVLVLDFDGRVLQLNRYGQELLGVTAEAAAGADWIERFVWPDDRHRVHKLFERSLMEPLRAAENCVVSRRGRKLLIRWYSSPLRNAAGEISSLLAIGYDITELRQKSERLRQAQKNEAIGRLVGGIAHDFNNQLAVVKGYCDLLLRENHHDEPTRQAVEQIMTAAERSSGMVSQLLVYGRKQLLRPAAVCLNELVREMADPLQRMIGDAIRLRLEPGENLGLVNLDKIQCQQSILNLAANARDAMPDGGELVLASSNVEIDAEYVSLNADASRGAHVLLSIKDTGIGMDSETLGRLFEPFFTTKPVGQGTGLGLAMVYGFIRQSGGHITVQSEQGKGSTFRIYLPRVDGLETPAGAGA